VRCGYAIETMPGSSDRRGSTVVLRNAFKWGWAGLAFLVLVAAASVAAWAQVPDVLAPDLDVRALPSLVVRWRCHCSPTSATVGPVPGGAAVFVMSPWRFFALDAATHDLLWDHKLDDATRPIGRPLLLEDRVALVYQDRVFLVEPASGVVVAEVELDGRVEHAAGPPLPLALVRSGEGSWRSRQEVVRIDGTTGQVVARRPLGVIDLAVEDGRLLVVPLAPAGEAAQAPSAAVFHHLVELSPEDLSTVASWPGVDAHFLHSSRVDGGRGAGRCRLRTGGGGGRRPARQPPGDAGRRAEGMDPPSAEIRDRPGARCDRRAGPGARHRPVSPRSRHRGAGSGAGCAEPGRNGRSRGRALGRPVLCAERGGGRGGGWDPRRSGRRSGPKQPGPEGRETRWWSSVEVGSGTRCLRAAGSSGPSRTPQRAWRRSSRMSNGRCREGSIPPEESPRRAFDSFEEERSMSWCAIDSNPDAFFVLAQDRTRQGFYVSTGPMIKVGREVDDALLGELPLLALDRSSDGVEARAESKDRRRGRHSTGRPRHRGRTRSAVGLVCWKEPAL